MSRISTQIDNVYSAWQRVMLYGPLGASDATPAQYYQMLHGYYMNNGVYDAIQQSAYENAIWTPAMKGLRNPAHRAVEFYVSKLWPGMLPDALPIVTTENRAKIIEPIYQIWAWSNFSANKQLGARYVSEYGDWFLKVVTNTKVPDRAVKDAGNGFGVVDLSEVTKATRVYFQNIKPEYVTEFDVDERGFVTYIRVEIQKSKTFDGKSVDYLHVETWSKDLQLYRRYEVYGGRELTNQTPVQTATFAEFGIDFVPFVHAKFQDIGEKRGIGCFVHALDKIDEANRMATRLHQILFRFNKPTMALSANAVDANNRPLPPPTISGATSMSVDVPDNDFWSLPGMATLNSIVPALDYASYLNAVNAQMDEIKQDLPEIKYFQLSDNGSATSGKAVRLLLGDSIDKVIELRGSMETALSRADEMALTMAQHAGIFSGLGNYVNGDFEHTFAKRDVIALSPQEEAEEEGEFWNTWANVAASGTVPFSIYAKERGWSDARVAAYKEANRAALRTAKTAVAP